MLKRIMKNLTSVLEKIELPAHLANALLMSLSALVSTRVEYSIRKSFSAAEHNPMPYDFLVRDGTLAARLADAYGEALNRGMLKISEFNEAIQRMLDYASR